MLKSSGYAKTTGAPFRFGIHFVPRKLIASHIIGKDRRQRRQITRAIVEGSEQIADCLLIGNDGIEIAHG
jgi:hypothetical protein